MKKLNELIETNIDCLVKGIKINSKEVEKGDMFVCVKGVKADRHDFIEEAIKNLNVLELTPMEAINILYDLKKKTK